jgi:hypothetical protein
MKKKKHKILLDYLKWLEEWLPMIVLKVSVDFDDNCWILHFRLYYYYLHFQRYDLMKMKMKM